MITLEKLPVETGVLPPSASVRVFRDSERDIRYRECLILLDGKHVADVDYRRRAEIQIPPGIHTIQASNRVRKSKPITFCARPGDRLTFQVGNVPGALFMVFFVLFQLGIPNIFLELEQPEGIEEGALALPDRWLR